MRMASGSNGSRGSRRSERAWKTIWRMGGRRNGEMGGGIVYTRQGQVARKAEDHLRSRAVFHYRYSTYSIALHDRWTCGTLCGLLRYEDGCYCVLKRGA
jgi:hypothetical protein